MSTRRRGTLDRPPPAPGSFGGRQGENDNLPRLIEIFCHLKCRKSGGLVDLEVTGSVVLTIYFLMHWLILLL
jgi:hypothetical protein